MKSKKNDMSELVYKTDSQTYKTNLWLTRGIAGGGGVDKLDVWD